MGNCNLGGWLFLVLVCGVSAAACSSDEPIAARKVVVETHVPEVKRILRGDIERHLHGVARAGERLGPGFAVEDPVQRDQQMRTALRLVGKPPKGIPELVSSARTFLAVVGLDGKVFAMDAKKDKDRMSGFDAGGTFQVVKRALGGEANYGVERFPAVEKGGTASASLVFAAPARSKGAIVGAVITGIPLWKVAQRMSRQLQLDHVSEQGAVLWVYLYTGEELHHFATPPDLDTVVPDGRARAAGLKRSPGGFTGQLLQFGRWYAYGVLPMGPLGEGAGAVIFRSDPT